LKFWPLKLIQLNGEVVASHIHYPKKFADMFEALMGAVFVDSGKNLNLLSNVLLDLMQNGICN
jgi:dsRNA-specific ribonuclease